MMKTAVVGAVMTVLATAAPGAEPTGLAEFAWGTTLDVLREQFLSRRCESHQASARSSALCYRYRVEAMTVLLLRLDFEPDDSLAGYYMAVASHSYPTLRSLTLQRFGSPTWQRRPLFRAGEELSWSWDNVQATLLQRCGEETACLEVKTLPLIRKRDQDRTRQAERLLQSL